MKIKCSVCGELVSSDNMNVKAGGLQGLTFVCDKCYAKNGFDTRGGLFI